MIYDYKTLTILANMCKEIAAIKGTSNGKSNYYRNDPLIIKAPEDTITNNITDTMVLLNNIYVLQCFSNFNIEYRDGKWKYVIADFYRVLPTLTQNRDYFACGSTNRILIANALLRDFIEILDSSYNGFDFPSYLNEILDKYNIRLEKETKEFGDYLLDFYKFYYEGKMVCKYSRDDNNLPFNVRQQVRKEYCLPLSRTEILYPIQALAFEKLVEIGDKKNQVLEQEMDKSADELAMKLTKNYD